MCSIKTVHIHFMQFPRFPQEAPTGIRVLCNVIRLGPSTTTYPPILFQTKKITRPFGVIVGLSHCTFICRRLFKILSRKDNQFEQVISLVSFAVVFVSDDVGRHLELWFPTTQLRWIKRRLGQLIFLFKFLAWLPPRNALRSEDRTHPCNHTLYFTLL